MELWKAVEYMGMTVPSVISFVGAGGKTSCMLEMAQHWAKQGEQVLVTTSTHMEHPERIGYPGSVDEDAQEILEKMQKNGWVIAGTQAAHPEKIQGLGKDVWKDAKEKADKVLIEADGSRRYPVKVPGEKEPIIYEETTHILIVAGVSALEKPLNEVCFRLEYAKKIVEDTDSRVTAEVLGKLLEESYVQPLKKDYPGRKIAVILNQADILENPEKTRQELENQVSVPVFLHEWNKSVHFIMLAAGFSKRFGENKLLYEVDGKPMYQHLFHRLRKLRQEKKADSLVAVSQYDEIIDAVKQQGEDAVKNENSAEGISSSLKLGLKRTVELQQNGKEHYYMFFVADQPYLQKETIAEFLAAFLKSGRKTGCVSHKGEPMNPVIFHEKYLPELMELKGDTGGKKVLKRHLEETFFYEASDEKEVMDFDCKTEIVNKEKENYES